MTNVTPMGKQIQTIADIVRVHGTERADHPALILDDRTLTWGELYGRAQQMANLLASVGVGADDRVAFLEKNGIEHYDDANTVIGGESIVGLKFPSADKTGIKIKLSGGAVDVKEGETSTLVVKFDVSKSFVVRGASIEQNGLLFKPVIRGERE